ncbi:hypothetical protein FK513_29455, partial [Klebsiella pneumoniae]|nr:hypothetical protein [Klebsiella pneumoniae]
MTITRNAIKRPMDLSVIRAQQTIADRFYALGLIAKPVPVREAVCLACRGSWRWRRKRLWSCAPT